ncbi:SRPBCC domain-containing protein [Maritalea sp.]|uniref:SRPBCC domain-containing protein n=1 Tax=Maritalea sp. TaxID=2003361 RepID=UPI003EF451B8
MSKLSLELEGDRHLIVRRKFAASPSAVYRAHTDEAIIQKWMLGPPGWTMPKCQCDPKPGGKIRYDWANDEGASFYLTGEFIELIPNQKTVHVERMHLPDPTPDNHVVTEFKADSSGTLMVMQMTMPDAATREAMLASGMENGMEESYVRLEQEISDAQ